MKKGIYIIVILILCVIVLIIYTYNNNQKNNLQKTLGLEYNNEVYRRVVEVSGGNEEEFSNKQEEYYKKQNERTFDKVSIEIKENTLTKTGATIIIKDENEIPYSFGNDYKLEKNIFGLWFRLPLKSGYSEDGLYGHGANGITEIKIDWKDRYGELKKRKV